MGREWKASEQGPVGSEAIVHVPGVGAADAVHELRHAAVGTVEHQVKVVVHQAIGDDAHTESLMCLVDERAEEDPLAVGVEDHLSAGAPVGDVVPGRQLGRSMSSSHGDTMHDGCDEVGAVNRAQPAEPSSVGWRRGCAREHRVDRLHGDR